MSGLWLGIFLAFAVVMDHTIQKENWENVHPFAIERKVKVEVVYYDKIEQVGYDMYLPVKDSIYVYKIKGNERNKRNSGDRAR